MIVSHNNAHLSYKYELLAIVSAFLIYEVRDGSSCQRKNNAPVIVAISEKA